MSGGEATTHLRSFCVRFTISASPTKLFMVNRTLIMAQMWQDTSFDKLILRHRPDSQKTEKRAWNQADKTPEA